MKECIKHGEHWMNNTYSSSYKEPTAIFQCECCKAMYRITKNELIKLEDKTCVKCPECGHLVQTISEFK